METPDFEALPIGTLLKVCENVLDDPPDGDALSLRQVVDKDGYIFRFTGLNRDGSTIYPVQAKSLATGNDTEFYEYEVEPVEKEQENG